MNDGADRKRMGGTQLLVSSPGIQPRRAMNDLYDPVGDHLELLRAVVGITSLEPGASRYHGAAGRR
jgi:hypothetical protein